MAVPAPMSALRGLCLPLLLLLAPAGACLAEAVVKDPRMSSGVVDATLFGPLGTEALAQRASRWSRVGVPSSLPVYLELAEVTGGMLARLRELGAAIDTIAPDQRLVQAWVPTARLEAVASLPGVTFVRLPDYGHHSRQGAVGAEGDAVIRAHLRRLALGASGAGMRIGVISDGIDGLTASIAAGELPAFGIVVSASRLSGSGIGLGDPLPGAVALTATPGDRPDLTAGAEGLALLEIIHDIAPGAELLFAPVGGTSLTYPRAVRWLAAQGVRVIADDVVFLNAGPYDGTSAVAREAEAAAASGIAYFQAVGNFARRHYRGAFTDSDGDGLQEFDASLALPRVDNAGETLNVTVPPGGRVDIYLQWDDPFGASANDYDLCVCDPADNPAAVLLCSTDVQDGSQNPTEYLAVVNTAPAAGTLGIRIDRFAAATARTFDLFVLEERMDEFVVPAGSVPNKADAGGGVISVGAVHWLAPGALQPFSSQGPTADGRLKPELVAPDGVATGVAGFAPFFGTSAATPHAAAVWALVLEHEPGLAPAQITDLLPGAVVDLGPPGADMQFGFGRLDAFAPAPRGSVSLDHSRYRSGDTLRLAVTLQPGSALNVGDAYVFALPPPGGAEAFSLTMATDDGLAVSDGLQPLAFALPVSPLSGTVFEYTFSGNEPPGFYRVLGILALPGEPPAAPDPAALEQTILFDGALFELVP